MFFFYFGRHTTSVQQRFTPFMHVPRESRSAIRCANGMSAAPSCQSALAFVDPPTGRGTQFGLQSRQT